MKISKLIAGHKAIMKKAQLAAQAQAYVTLCQCVERVRRARLSGLVNLCQPSVHEGRLWAALTALEGNQSVIEEHFTEEELLEFADALAIACAVPHLNVTFRLETLRREYLLPFENELKQAGVVMDVPPNGFKSSSSNIASSAAHVRRSDVRHQHE